MNTKLALQIIATIYSEKKFYSSRIQDVWATVFPIEKFPSHWVCGFGNSRSEFQDFDLAKERLLEAAIKYIEQKFN